MEVGIVFRFFKLPACMLSCFSHVQPFAAPWTVARQAPLSMGFSSKNNGVGCHALLRRIFPNQGLNPCLLRLLHCRQILYCWATREALFQSSCPILYSFHPCMRIQLLYILSNTTRRCVVTTLCGFICLSLMTSDTEYLFMCFFGIYVSSLAEWLFKSFAFFIGLFVFLFSFMNSQYSPDAHFFSNLCFQIFPLSL